MDYSAAILVVAMAFMALFCLVFLVPQALRADTVFYQARAEARELGCGDEQLGQRILDCDARIKSLLGEAARLKSRLATVAEAASQLAHSRFHDRAALFQRAEALLKAQLDGRQAVIAEWQRLRADLTALAAARKAEAAIGGLDLSADMAALDEEHSRLQGAVDELMALDQVEVELSGCR